MSCSATNSAGGVFAACLSLVLLSCGEPPADTHRSTVVLPRLVGFAREGSWLEQSSRPPEKVGLVVDFDPDAAPIARGHSALPSWGYPWDSDPSRPNETPRRQGDPPTVVLRIPGSMVAQDFLTLVPALLALLPAESLNRTWIAVVDEAGQPSWMRWPLSGYSSTLRWSTATLQTPGRAHVQLKTTTEGMIVAMPLSEDLRGDTVPVVDAGGVPLQQAELLGALRACTAQSEESRVLQVELPAKATLECWLPEVLRLQDAARAAVTLVCPRD